MMTPPVSTNASPSHAPLGIVNRDDNAACNGQKQPRTAAIIHRTSLKGSTLVTQCPKQAPLSPSVINAPGGDKAAPAADNESMVKQVYRPAQHLQKMVLHTPVASINAGKAVVAERRKLVVVGDGNIGKTCLLLSFTKHTFTQTYTPTVFENHVAEVQLVDRPDGATAGTKRGKSYTSSSSSKGGNTGRRKSKAELERRVELALWDTAGQEDYDRLRPLSYPDSDIILLCFAVDTPGSLEHVRLRWAAEVTHFCAGVPMVLVGLKSDLRNSEPASVVADGVASKTDPSSNRKQRKLVSVEEAQDAAFRIGARAYVECSAKSGDGVEDVFARALQEVWNAEREAAKKRRRWLLRKCAIM